MNLHFARMSIQKLNKFLEKSVDQPIGVKTHVPVILSDSKGRYLQQFSECSGINIWHFSGKSSAQLATELELCLPFERKSKGPLFIYVWGGTCDLSRKRGQVCEIRCTDDSSVGIIISNYEKIATIAKQHNCKIRFLHTPTFSLSEYNKKLRNKNWVDYIAQDCEVHRQISVLNVEIDKLNDRLGLFGTPKFNLDLVCSRGGTNRRRRYSFNFKLFTDGVHPGDILARYWLRKIVLLINRDCYQKVEAEDILQICVSQEELDSLEL